MDEYIRFQNQMYYVLCIIVDCTCKPLLHFFIEPSRHCHECLCRLFFSLAAQREQYIKDKVDQVTTYKRALDAQVRFQKAGRCLLS